MWSNRYRFGSGAHVGRPYSAASPQEAWDKGRLQAISEHSSRVWHFLEREFHLQYEPPVLLSPSPTQRDWLDMQAAQSIWARVAAGYPDSGWIGAPKGGVVLEATKEGTTPTRFEFDPLKALEHYTKDAGFIRSSIIDGLAKHDRSEFASTDFSVWIGFCKNKHAEDNFGALRISATRETWEKVVASLK